MSADDDGCRGTFVSVTPPPLITFIQNVLKDYPDGGQTLKVNHKINNDITVCLVVFKIKMKYWTRMESEG